MTKSDNVISFTRTTVELRDPNQLSRWGTSTRAKPQFVVSDTGGFADLYLTDTTSAGEEKTFALRVSSPQAFKVWIELFEEAARVMEKHREN